MADAAPTDRPPRERVSPLAAVAIGVAGLVVVFGGAFLLVFVVIRDTRVLHSSYHDVRRLSVTAGDGDVELTAAPAGAALTVEEHVTETFESPRLRRSLRGGHLRLRSSCDTWLPGACGVRYVISVPAGTSVSAQAGGGDVSARRLVADGAVRLSTGSGGVSAIDVSAARLSLESGSGDIGGVALRAGRLSAGAGSGTIVLELSEPADALRASTGDGDVLLTVPDVPYALQAPPSAGGLFNEGLRVDPDSERTIVAMSGSGEVRLAVTGRAAD